MSSSVLGAVALVTNGKTPPVSEQREAGFPVLKIRDVDALGNFRGPFASFVDGPFAEKFSAKHLQQGDTLILNAAHNADYVASKTFYAKSSLGTPLVTGEWTIVRPNPARADSGYVRHFIESTTAKQQLKEMVNGIHLYPKDVARLSLPLPPLPEQRRIAAILDKADALRVKRREAIAKLDQLLQSVFLDMFGDPVANPKGWPKCTLEEVAEFYAGNSLPEAVPFENQSDGFLALKVSDLNLPGNEDALLIAKQWVDGVRRGAIKCPAGAIVFPKRGGAIGTNKKRRLMRAAYLDPNLMGVSPKDERLVPSYLYHWFKRFNLSDIASGSSVPQLNKRDLAPLEILVPPLPQQRRFAAICERLVRQSGQSSLSLAGTNRLFDALQEAAFPRTL